MLYRAPRFRRTYLRDRLPSLQVFSYDFHVLNVFIGLPLGIWELYGPGCVFSCSSSVMSFLFNCGYLLVGSLGGDCIRYGRE